MLSFEWHIQHSKFSIQNFHRTIALINTDNYICWINQTHEIYMKKFLLAILAVGTVATAQAQKPGSILIYGNAGFTTYKNTDDDGLPGSNDVISKDNMWNFSPGVGYQLNRNWTVGLNFNISGTRESIDYGAYTTENKMRELGVGPFVRMTMPIGRIFFLYNQLNVSYLSGKSTMDDGAPVTPDVEETYKGFGAVWFPAVGVNFTKCLALNFSFGGLGYAQRNWDMTGPQEVKESVFGVTFGRQFNLGISANLGGRRMKSHGMEPGMDRRHMDTSDDSEEDMPKRNSSDIEE